MNNIWFTSDTHFFHKKIIEYEKETRPFKNIDEMHEALITRWNSVVKPKDTIFHLGDFMMGRGNIHIVTKLNGLKRLIMGNHDLAPTTEYSQYFKCYGAFNWEHCILTHIPIHPNMLEARWFLNVHGHLHSKKVHNLNAIPDDRYFNVCVEQNNLTPIHADIIRDAAKRMQDL